MLQLKAGMQRPLEKGPSERRVDGQQTQPEEAGSSSVSHSGKYRSLIQDQARELTHLRQKMRMGRAFSSLLIQHVKNTVKTFEELLSSNKVDPYMEQHFREQLTKGSLLAESLASKFSTDDCTSEKNQARQMLRTLSILRDKHMKGKVTEVLRTMQEAQPQTLPQIHSSNRGQSAAHPSSSSTSLLHEEPEACPSVDVTDVSQATPADSASLLSNHPDARSAQPSYPPSSATQLSRMPDPGHRGSGGPQDEMRPQKMNASGHLSSFSSLYRPNSKPSGADLLEKNLVEIQNLRQRLEESICFNDRLQERLEHVLSSADQGKNNQGVTSCELDPCLALSPSLSHFQLNAQHSLLQVSPWQPLILTLRVTLPALPRMSCDMMSGWPRRMFSRTFPALFNSILGCELGGIDIDL
ncbi:myomegalin isoform X1 [Mustela erminea]|uniref:myomegalin isoform X1 n=2 Tax=Mustela erminea TaxID=36723 RepID=UPI0013866CF4|nr:myomegalin isoform X1 [Mustela erminea]XP_032157572.1 myomegalin isoform X1 [Mustela erminea]XP_032157573.1 myomegalin isoform X1 [Mustela erminea]XP_032157574.1 myomegalin isoform X1 [Mustela erminea]XP_032157576.1 myomegalin isoform X1 [Mustela erminea]XP_032157577.1 myomegalin isoform X1 [Mustela erminea]XP_032157578.1 myomegalin isoform X1 [Mustela erminea]XP_032157579.1 myomegalin isoform X1 [Mustela erminea]XP_032157580.1 myomegalin isoform X1 [Mustela erminea]XP_032157582.1 myome